MTNYLPLPFLFFHQPHRLTIYYKKRVVWWRKSQKRLGIIMPDKIASQPTYLLKVLVTIKTRKEGFYFTTILIEIWMVAHISSSRRVGMQVQVIDYFNIQEVQAALKIILCFLSLAESNNLLSWTFEFLNILKWNSTVFCC